MKTKGNNIQLMTAIRAQGLTQRSVADAIGVHESRVSRWVRDETIIPQQRHRSALVRIGIDVYENEEK